MSRTPPLTVDQLKETRDALEANRLSLYALLNITEHDTHDRVLVERACRASLLKYHPDKFSESPDSMAVAAEISQLILKAKDVFSDPEKRQQYLKDFRTTSLVGGLDHELQRKLQMMQFSDLVPRYGEVITTSGPIELRSEFKPTVTYMRAYRLSLFPKNEGDFWAPDLTIPIHLTPNPSELYLPLPENTQQQAARPHDNHATITSAVVPAIASSGAEGGGASSQLTTPMPCTDAAFRAFAESEFNNIKKILLDGKIETQAEFDSFMRSFGADRSSELWSLKITNLSITGDIRMSACKFTIDDGGSPRQIAPQLSLTEPDFHGATISRYHHSYESAWVSFVRPDFRGAKFRGEIRHNPTFGSGCKNPLFDIPALLSADHLLFPKDHIFRLEYRSAKKQQPELTQTTIKGNELAVIQDETKIISVTAEDIVQKMRVHYRAKGMSRFVGFFHDALSDMEKKLNTGFQSQTHPYCNYKESELFLKVLHYIEKNPKSDTATAFREACEDIFKIQNPEVLAITDNPQKGL